MSNRYPSDKIKFMVGGIYRNAIGQYEVLTLSDSTMRVEYSDGTISTLSVSVQQKIVSRIMRETKDRRTLAEAQERHRILAEAQERHDKKWAPVRRIAEMLDRLIPAHYLPEREHKGRCNKPSTCPICSFR